MTLSISVACLSSARSNSCPVLISLSRCASISCSWKRRRAFSVSIWSNLEEGNKKRPVRKWLARSSSSNNNNNNISNSASSSNNNNNSYSSREISNQQQH